MDLAGRVAIVTGGGTGIGRATSIRLAKAGAKAVVVNYSRSAAEAESTAEELRLLGAEALPWPANIADESMVKNMIASTVDRYGSLDVLVNNAGTTHFIPHTDLDALTDQVWDDILSVNLKGTFFCCRAAAAALASAGGAIVNISSIAAYRASGSSIPYAVSKAGVLQLRRRRGRRPGRGVCAGDPTGQDCDPGRCRPGRHGPARKRRHHGPGPGRRWGQERPLSPAFLRLQIYGWRRADFWACAAEP